MDNERYTITDVAKAMGVSRATVSRALSGASGVSNELREKIINYSNEIGYKPNPVAQGLSGGCMKAIGLIFGDVRNPFYADLTYYIQSEFNKNGYTVMIFNSEYDVEKEHDYIRMSEEFHLAGLILFTAQSNMKKDYLSKLKIPIVFVNRFLEVRDYDIVSLDNFQAGYIAAMHLIELGHRRIGVINGNHLSSASHLRYEGVRQALKNCFLELKDDDVMSGDLKMPKGYELAKKFFEKKSRPSAFVIGNDMMALGFMDYCFENHIRIPDEISIVSFDNINFSAMHGIGLTTVSQHVKRMGELTVELMLRRIANPDVEYKRVILEPTLVIRNSTAKYIEK